MKSKEPILKSMEAKEEYQSLAEEHERITKSIDKKLEAYRGIVKEYQDIGVAIDQLQERKDELHKELSEIDLT